MTGFSRNGDTKIAKDCRLDTDYYAKTTSKMWKYSALHKPTMLANSFDVAAKIVLCKLSKMVHFLSKAKLAIYVKSTIL